ncbi:MAG: galactose-1-phosphate uridylyltransferase [Chloroflexota bacterium]|nr:galactose-1-phosphate uridylyltransferase [Chloroflexota bacterium]
MSELRWHPVLREWVITATQRQDRTFLPPRDYCPLCPTKPGGFETEIPRPDFEIAVFENRFPSLRPNPPEPAIEPNGLFDVRPAQGECEVVVYTPQHDTTLAQQTTEHIHRLIQVWTHRYQELGALPYVEYVFIFENKGEVIGVTLHHPHGQIYAYPFVPPIAHRQLESARLHLEGTGRCLHCDVLRLEAEDGRRVLLDDGQFAAVIPFYARWPYEVHLVPKRHGGALPELTGEETWSLARALKRVLVGYDRLFGFSMPYILAMHQAPTDGQEHPYAHFHLELYPPHRTATKLKYLAGSETGMGTFINDSLPEEKAEELRGVLPGEEEI